MKPVSLEFEGVNSYQKPVKIDFEQLISRGLFGIFGRTGSGKSTILDAMTLALYGNISRGTKEFVNSNSDTAHIDFVFEIIEGADRITYRVTRRYTKTKSDSKVSVKNNYVRLMRKKSDGEYEVICDKVKEVKAEIERIIGLNEGDFLKSVVLPQGKFSEFLSLSGKDRRDMLERIFNLYDYGTKLNEKLSKRKYIVADKMTVLETRKAEYTEVSKENLEELKNNLDSSKRHLSIIKGDLDNKQNRRNILDSVYVEYEKFVGVLKQIDSLEEKRGEIESYEKKLEQDAKASKIAPSKNRLQQLDKEISDLKFEIEKVDKDILSIRVDIENTSKKIKEHLSEEKKIEYYQDISREINYLSEYFLELLKVKNMGVDEKALRDKKKKELEGYIHRKKDKDKDIEDTKVQLSNLECEIEKNKVDDNLWNDAIEVKNLMLDISSLEKDQGELKKVIDSEIKKCINFCMELDKKKKDIYLLEDEYKRIEKEKMELSKINVAGAESLQLDLDEFLKAFTDLSSKIEIEKKETAGLYELEQENIKNKGRLKELLLDRKKSEQELQRIERKLNDKRIKSLTYQLKNVLFDMHKDHDESIVCPICNSNVDLEAINIDEDTDIGSFQSEMDDKKRILEDINKEISLLEYKVLEDEKKISAKDISKERLTNFEKEIEQLKEKIEEKKKAIETLRSKEKEKFDLEKKIIEDESKLENKKTSLKSDIKILENSIASFKEKKEKDKQIFMKNESHISEMNKKIDEILKSYKENIDKENFFRGVEEKRTIMISSKSKYEELSLKREKDLEAKLDIEKDISKIEVEILNIDSTLNMYREQYKSINSKANEKKSKIVEYIDDKLLEKEVLNFIKSSDCSSDFNSIKEKIESIILKTRRIKEELEKKIDDLKVREKALLDEKLKFEIIDEERKSQQVEIKKEYECLLKEYSISGEEIEKSILDIDTKDVFERRVKGYFDNLNNLITQKGILEDSLKSIVDKVDFLEYNFEKLGAIKKEIEEISTEIKFLEDTLEKSQANINTLEYRIGEMKKNLDVLKEIEKEMKKVKKSQDDISKLERVLKGNRFVEYLSKISMRKIVFDASKRLLRITGGRYSLEIDSQYNFVVCDNFNGGIKRLADTMSGGETFLTSLALSLSLSSQIQLKGSSPLEFFFLDEGFGTLDPDTLDTVMSTLENLKGESLSIGIISHVEEMKNRMPIKLIVDFDERESTSRVSIELS